VRRDAVAHVVHVDDAAVGHAVPREDAPRHEAADHGLERRRQWVGLLAADDPRGVAVAVRGVVVAAAELDGGAALAAHPLAGLRVRAPAAAFVLQVVDVVDDALLVGGGEDARVQLQALEDVHHAPVHALHVPEVLVPPHPLDPLRLGGGHGWAARAGLVAKGDLDLETARLFCSDSFGGKRIRI
jgi:hypothetical protein